jgi:hypothetical protein
MGNDMEEHGKTIMIPKNHRVPETCHNFCIIMETKTYPEHSSWTMPAWLALRLLGA